MKIRDYVVCEEGPTEPARKRTKEEEKKQEKECHGSTGRGGLPGVGVFRAGKDLRNKKGPTIFSN